jgi:hypothetical protein
VASGSLDPASSSRPPKLVNLFLTPYYARQEYNRFYTVASLCDKLKLVLHIDIVDIVDEYALFFLTTTGAGAPKCQDLSEEKTLFPSPDLIEARLGAIEELLSKPEILSGLQSALARFFDIDQLLSLCAVVPKEQVASINKCYCAVLL